MKLNSKGQRCSVGELAAACGASVEQVRHACEAISAASGGNIEYDAKRGVCEVASEHFECMRELMPRLIEICAEGERIGHDVVVFNETDSTNDIAWGYSGLPERSGMVVLAESQRKGRGRFSDRSWQDVRGCSILMSILVDAEGVDGEVLSVALGLAAAKSLEQVCGLEVGIKWPNDILADGKKLCGIMVESRVVNGRRWNVLGIGMNCNQGRDDFADELKEAATSVYIVTGRIVDRNLLVVTLLDDIDELLSGAVERDEIVRQWRSRNCDAGRMITVVCDGNKYSGKVVEVKPIEGITLLLDDGSERVFDCRKTMVISKL